jgi:hypothetical protein
MTGCDNKAAQGVTGMNFAPLQAFTSLVPGRCVMYTQTELDEYMAEIRDQVCVHCIDRPLGGPPCAPLGKQCGIECNLPGLIDVVRGVHAEAIDSYIDHFHDDVCTRCPNRLSSQCPCPLEYLLTLAVQAIETVQLQKANRTVALN